MNKIIILLILISSIYANLPLEKLKLPPGFKAEIYARVRGARQMTFSPSGVLFVGSFRDGVVSAVLPKTKEVITVATGLTMPTGIWFLNGHLYVTAVSRLLRYDNIERDLRNPPRPTVIAQFPSDTHHGWKYLKSTPDGRKFVTPVGAPCNICNTSDPYATLLELNIDGSNQRVIARGIRNTVGFDFDPVTGALWFTENGRDQWGDDKPPDELNILSRNQEHFGFPFCYGKDLVDPQFNRDGNCNKYTPSTYDLGPHVAALGMTFYRGNKFPQKYRNKIFIAEHGSWNRRTPIGYRITWVDPDDRSPKSYQVFVDGWLNLPTQLRKDGKGPTIKDSPHAFGRPADVINDLSDGSLLVSDDKSGTVYKISYIG